ncbi:hypothetical protein OH492_15020 [Vibrio chagasii]|nr:hypothetical protein [Vibrio chagasii]
MDYNEASTFEPIAFRFFATLLASNDKYDGKMDSALGRNQRTRSPRFQDQAEQPGWQKTCRSRQFTTICVACSASKCWWFCKEQVEGRLAISRHQRKNGFLHTNKV